MEHPINELRHAVADYLARKPPKDTVGNPPLTRAEILALDANHHRDVAARELGGITDDGVGPAVAYPDDTLTAPVLPRRVLAAAGVDPADVPHITVVD